MLFVAPKSMHQGIDKKLLKYGVDKYNVNKLTVNEQNTPASKFYTHFGFKPCNRAPLDEQSRPYPLLYMKLQ